jgi:hypothetical protein
MLLVSTMIVITAAADCVRHRDLRVKSDGADLWVANNVSLRREDDKAALSPG